MKSETITILFIGDDDTEPRVLFENFPKAVATTFSTEWRDQFSTLPKRKLSGPVLAPLKKSLTIKGGNFNTYRQILHWMLSCCDGYGIRPCPDPAVRRFTTAYLIRMCANHIGCDHLVKVTTDRMQYTANAQIHSEDVRALWLMTPADAAMKQFLVDHVATRFWLKSLRGKSTYWTLREEIPEFNNEIKEALNVKATASKAEKEKNAAARKGLGADRGCFRDGHRQYARQARQPEQKVMEQKDVRQPEQKVVEQQAIRQPQKGTIMLHAEVVRKGVNGRPSYAKLDLASIGVTKEKFCIKK